jgi:transketolase
VAELTSGKSPVVVRRVGVRDQFGESGTSAEIKECYGLTPVVIKKVAYEAMKVKRMKKITKPGRR